MKLIILTILLSISGFNFLNEIEETTNNNFIHGIWDPNTNSFKVYWKNGNVHYIDTIINNELLRLQFDSFGNKTLEVPILQKHVLDTIYTPCIGDTSIFEYVVDKPNGIYKEFNYEGILLKTGLYLNGIPQNEWKEYWTNGKLKKVYNFNKKGELEGTFKFYNNGLLSYSGKIAVVEPVEIFTFSPYTCNDTIIREYKSVPIGKWKFYNNEKKLIKTITFKY